MKTYYAVGCAVVNQESDDPNDGDDQPTDPRTFVKFQITLFEEEPLRQLHIIQHHHSACTGTMTVTRRQKETDTT